MTNALERELVRDIFELANYVDAGPADPWSMQNNLLKLSELSLHSLTNYLK